jgi:glucosylceramidase
MPKLQSKISGVVVVALLLVAASIVEAKRSSRKISQPVKIRLSQVYVSLPTATGTMQAQSYTGDDAYPYYNAKPAGELPKLTIDLNRRMHVIWGFGGSVTDSCMGLLARQTAFDRHQIMQALFDPHQGAGLSFLRIPLGANDFSDGDYTLNDLPPGETDPQLKKMNLGLLDPAIQFSKKAKFFREDLTLMVTPWTPPPWMKDTLVFKGGQLKKEYYPTYAEYLRRSMDYIETKGLRVSYLTAMNEPLIGEAQKWWYFPQGYMSIDDQFDFAVNHLLPLLKKYPIDADRYPHLLLHDHNWGNHAKTVDRFSSVIATKRSGIAGVAMHCYGGDFSVQREFHKKWSNLASLNTECTANLYSKSPAFDFQWWLENQVLDSTQIGSRGSLAWNICLDEKGGPKNNGCHNCRGLVTINEEKKIVEFNTEYYALAQVSRFVRKGARVIAHTVEGETPLRALTVLNPDRTLVVVVRNPSKTEASLQMFLGEQSQHQNLVIPPQSAATFSFSSVGFTPP